LELDASDGSRLHLWCMAGKPERNTTAASLTLDARLP
jgi:hypothetical protein